MSHCPSEDYSPLRRFRNPAEMAPIAGPIDEKLIKRLDGRLLHAPDQAAMRTEGPA
jgi:hypothetical protein